MKFSRIFSKNFTKAFLVGGLLVILSSVGFRAVQAEFYPDRPTYDYNKECDPNDNDPYDRCGSLNGPVFNSFINTPSYGDERQFVDAKATDRTNDAYKDLVTGASQGAKEVKIRLYVHNNANPATNQSGAGVAKNTKVKITLPTGAESEQRARGYIGADNATLVEDTVDFTAPEKFRVEYVPGSAIIYNNNAFTAGQKLDDSIVTTGALIGDDALDGELPGCFEYHATVFVTVKIVPETKPAIKFNKLVKTEAQGAQWGEEVTVKPGEKVNWLIETINDGSQNLTNIVVDDVLPPHLTVVPGSVRIIDNDDDVALDDAQVFNGGYKFSSLVPKAGFYIRFQTTAKDDFTECEVKLRNIAKHKTTELPAGEDYADVNIKKETCNQPPTPSVVCTSLEVASVTLKKGAHTTLTAKATASNATVNGFIFKVNGAVVKETNSANDNTYDFSQGSTGTYQVSVDVKSSLGTVAASDACKKSITVTEEAPLPSYTCDSFTLSKNTVKLNEKFTATVKVNAQNGAQFKQATFTFGDEAANGTKFLTNTITNGVVTAEHAYATAGDYAPRVKLEFTVNGETKTVEDAKCAAQIKVEKPVLAATTPTTLPKTGASEVAGIFSAVTVAGAAIHRRSTLKKRRSDSAILNRKHNRATV